MKFSAMKNREGAMGYKSFMTDTTGINAITFLHYGETLAHVPIKKLHFQLYVNKKLYQYTCTYIITIQGVLQFRVPSGYSFYHEIGNTCHIMHFFEDVSTVVDSDQP